MTMADKSASGVAVELIDTAALCSIDELSVACNVDADWIAELVEHGVIEPIGRSRSGWKFTSLTIVRVAKAKRLERDLDINPAGLGIVLDLLDQIEDLHAQIKKTQSRVK